MTTDISQLVQNHPRDFRSQRYVYPVISRRSRGVSIGINLSPTGLCNFRCIYCQVDGEIRLSNATGDNQANHLNHTAVENSNATAWSKFSLSDYLLPEYAPDTAKQCHVRSNGPDDQSITIDLDVLEDELRQTLTLAVTGELFKIDAFQKTPPQFRRLNDIAFSGNGEPTLSPQFADAVQVVLRVRDELGANTVKPILITNATVMQRPSVAEALELIVECGGEVWAKLDAGTAAYYEQVSRSRVPFATIVDNIGQTAKRHQIIIQTLFMKIHDEPTPETELQAYIDRLNEIIRQGGQIKLVQLYTAIRDTAEPWVSPLTSQQLDALANRVRNETNLDVNTYHSS